MSAPRQDCLTVTWAHHASHMASAFQELYHAALFADVTVDYGGAQVFHGHRLLLAAKSTYFAERSNERHVRLDVEIRPDVFRYLVEYMYFGRVEFLEADSADLFEAGKKLGVVGFRDCVDEPDRQDGGRDPDLGQLEGDGDDDVVILEEISAAVQQERGGRGGGGRGGGGGGAEVEEGGHGGGGGGGDDQEQDVGEEGGEAPEDDDGIVIVEEDFAVVEQGREEGGGGGQGAQDEEREDEQEQVEEGGGGDGDDDDQGEQADVGGVEEEVRGHVGADDNQVQADVEGEEGGEAPEDEAAGREKRRWPKVRECMVSLRRLSPARLPAPPPPQPSSSSSNGSNKKKPKCPDCGIIFATEIRVKRHVLSVHQKGKRHQCKLCQFKTNGVTRLRDHVDAVHLGKKKFACKLCPFKTGYSVNLKVHVDAIHLGKKFACKLCPFKTGYSSLLSNHNDIVHLQLEFRCEQCDVSFSSKGGKELHVRSVHQKVKPYSCPKCAYRSSQKSHVKKHIATKHGGKAVPVKLPESSSVVVGGEAAQKWRTRRNFK